VTLIFTMFIRSRFVLLSIMKTNLSEHMVAKKTELLALPGKARCIKQSSTSLSLVHLSVLSFDQQWCIAGLLLSAVWLQSYLTKWIPV